MSKRVIKIGTRDSDLAMWQAKKVEELLSDIDLSCEIIPVKSKGDLDRTKPLHELGTVGVFTKVLDDALLSGEVDVAVHSLKDVPTIPEAGLHQAALLERDNPRDLFIGSNSPEKILDNQFASVVATGSIRRKAQWHRRFPAHSIVGIRGNVPSRIAKVSTENIDGTILSAAGVYRLGLSPGNSIELDWMVPAPAQGVIGVFCRKDDSELVESIAQINHQATYLTSYVERQVLNVLEGGCSAPIGVYAEIRENTMHVEACLLSLDGKKAIYEKIKGDVSYYRDLGKQLANIMLEKGGKEIIKELSNGK